MLFTVLICMNYYNETNMQYGLIAEFFICVVSSGSITINEDSSVQILAEEACTVDQLDGQVSKVPNI